MGDANVPVVGQNHRVCPDLTPLEASALIGALTEITQHDDALEGIKPPFRAALLRAEEKILRAYFALPESVRPD